MPRNGSGVYSSPVNSWNPQINGALATAPDFAAQLADLGNALTQSISADGQTAITGNINMNGNKIRNLAAGTGAGDSLRWEQLFSQGIPQDLASSATTDIGSQNTNFLKITGTTTITSFGTAYNGPRFLTFAGVLTLTYDATTLVIPGGANIVTAAGDVAIVIPKSTISGTSDGWLVVAYQSGANLTPRAVQNQTYTAFTTAGTGTAYTLTPVPPIVSYTAGQSFFVTFNQVSGATPTLQISGIATPPNLVRELGDGSYVNISAGDIPANHRSRVTLLSATQALIEDMPPTLPRAYIDGFNMSAPTGGTTLTIRGGQAADSNNAFMLSRSSTYTKTLLAWAVGSGNGGKLSAAAVAINTWYYVYEIKRYDTAVEDVGFDISPTSPTLPANYNIYRRIGAFYVNSSTQIEGFVQDGDFFQWIAPATESFGITTTSTLRTLTRAPSGVKVIARNAISIADPNGAINSAYHWDPALGSTRPGNPGVMQMFVNTTSFVQGYSTIVDVQTNTSGQIYNGSGGTIPTYTLMVQGWFDQRGKNS